MCFEQVIFWNKKSKFLISLSLLKIPESRTFLISNPFWSKIWNISCKVFYRLSSCINKHKQFIFRLSNIFIFTIRFLFSLILMNTGVPRGWVVCIFFVIENTYILIVVDITVLWYAFKLKWTLICRKFVSSQFIYADVTK